MAFGGKLGGSAAETGRVVSETIGAIGPWGEGRLGRRFDLLLGGGDPAQKEIPERSGMVPSAFLRAAIQRTRAASLVASSLLGSTTWRGAKA